MIDGDHPAVRVLWPLLASIAGAMTALSFRPFKKMNAAEIAVALIVSTSFAMFVGPWAAHWVFGKEPVDIRLVGGLFYLMATGSNILIPLAVKHVSRFFGVSQDKDGL